MTRLPLSFPARLVLTMLAALTLSACGAGERIANIGKAPDLSPISNPTTDPNYVPVRMPMPAPRVDETQPNSLWQAGSRTFFRDARASQVGDILTVKIEIDDEASISNETQRSRANSESAEAPNILGYGGTLDGLLPDDLDLDNLIDLGSDSSSAGAGSVARGEQIELQLASVVTDVLPNGNLVIYGRQEVRVNFEVRELAIAGIIRPSDITSSNTVSYEKIAEARISYGGRGQITDVQQPRYGQQLYDIIFPF